MAFADLFLKAELPMLAKSLCDIFNLSLAAGVFPKFWKAAKVVPIFKSAVNKLIAQITDLSQFSPVL